MGWLEGNFDASNDPLNESQLFPVFRVMPVKLTKTYDGQMRFSSFTR